MYEEVSLREERVELAKQFVINQNNLKIENSVVIIKKEKPSILYNLVLLFINNKQQPHSYLFAYTPLFDYNSNKDGSIKVPYVFPAKLIDLTFTKNNMHGKSFKVGELISISSISHYPDLIHEFESWNAGYKTINNSFQFDSSIDFFIPHILIPEIREFQRM